MPQGGNLVASLHRYAPILKDAAFSEEREWRIISRPIMCSNERFDYRPGPSMLIPYYRVPISFPDRALKRCSKNLYSSGIPLTDFSRDPGVAKDSSEWKCYIEPFQAVLDLVLGFGTLHCLPQQQPAG